MIAYPYSKNTVYVNDGIVSVIVGLVAVVLVCTLAVRLTLFVFRALSLHKIARRRGIRVAWLAWLPVGNNWVLGSIADQYQYVVKGRIKNRRLLLLLLSIVVTVLQAAASAAGISLLFSYIRIMLGGTPYETVMPTLLAFALPVIAGAGSVAWIVIRSFCVYDLYTSCATRLNVLYLVLGLVFRFLEPIFFFVCRNKEEGMPPRREAPVFRETEALDEE